MSNNPPSERRMCSPFIHHPVPTKMLRLGLVSNFHCRHICNNTQFINDWQIFNSNCQSLRLQKMIFLPAHLSPSKTGKTICGILLFLGLVLYRLILLFLRDVIPKKCIGSTTFCIALAAFCCIWPLWRSTRTVMWTGRWKRRLFLEENHMRFSPHTFPAGASN